MSTKNIEAVLLCLRNGIRPADGVVSAAGDDVRAIREAAKTLDRLHVGDYVYNVRTRAAEDAAFIGNTWDHPDVKAWSDASVLLGAIAKEE